MDIKKVNLGTQGLIVPALGLGCMGMTGFEDGHMYGPADEKEAIATIHRSLELGGKISGYGRFVRALQKRAINSQGYRRKQE
jgi:hypothetical protein